jgi:hypothetical protein
MIVLQTHSGRNILTAPAFVIHVTAQAIVSIRLLA